MIAKILCLIFGHRIKRYDNFLVKKCQCERCLDYRIIKYKPSGAKQEKEGGA